MATLVPSIGSCTFDTGGERRFAERLESKLEDDYLCWYDVPVGNEYGHPDFIVLHPGRGLLVLEVKDWRSTTLERMDKQHAWIHADGQLKQVRNPLEQARDYAEALVRSMQRDAQLTIGSGREAGRLRFPWSYGVVFPNLTRKQFDDGGLDAVMPGHRVICKDEMLEDVDCEAFQQRLWEMFKLRFHSRLSLPDIDRIRWHVFPDVRIPQRQEDLFVDQVPDLLQVMDMQQEQLARSLGDGHRVIHGVAGSGKTLILGYRAEHLAKGTGKPILVLCYNDSLARRLARMMEDKGLSHRVRTHNFHQWCRAQLVTFCGGVPSRQPEQEASAFYNGMVDQVIRGVDSGLIPRGQYAAILIDEGHDFKPEWLKLVVQMVDPASNSLLVLYDDAQSIYGDEKKKKFSFKSVGIQAMGRTTILKVNYRNTNAILKFARDVAQGVLRPADADDDGVPLIQPQPGGRTGPAPEVVNLPSLKDEAVFIAERLKAAHRNGTRWRDMAVIYRDYHRDAKLIRKMLPAYGVPMVYFEDATYAADDDRVTLITMHSCKGLEFPLVVIPGADRIPSTDEMPPQEARLLYVAMTRATQELVLCGVGP